MKKVAVIGHGYVGKQMARMLSHSHDVIAYDKDFVMDEVEREGNCDLYRTTGDKQKTQGADLAVICVPTPMAPDGSCDTSIVREVCGWIDADLVVIKSTVSPGFTESCNAEPFFSPKGDRIHFSPEYAGEPVNYVPSQYPNPRDSRTHDFCIVGGP